LLIMAAFVVVVAGMRAAESILVPFLLSAFIAIISSPPLFWLKQKGVPAGIAMLLVISGIMGTGLAFVILLGSSLSDFSNNLPFYQSRLQEEEKMILTWLESTGIEISEQALLKYFNPGKAIQLFGNMLSGLGGVLTNSFMILLTVIFILFEASSFPSKLQAMTNNPNTSFASFDKFFNDVKHYMAIKTSVSLLTGIAIAIWLALLGVDYPLLWGFLAFLFNYIPAIGSIIAAVPAVLMSFVQLGINSSFLVALGYFVLNVVIGNIIEPRLMGHRLGLSTLIVFLSLLFWGWVLGPVGMLLSIPLTMMLKIALEGNEDTRSIAIFLGTGSSAITASSDPPKASTDESSGSKPAARVPDDVSQTSFLPNKER